MDTLKQEITRRLEELSPEELQAVHQLITTFKRPPERTQDENAEQPAQSNAPAPDAVRIREGFRDTSSLRSGRTLKALPRYRSGRTLKALPV